MALEFEIRSRGRGYACFERLPRGGGKSDAYPAEEVILEGVGSLREVLLGGLSCPVGEDVQNEGEVEFLSVQCSFEGMLSCSCFVTEAKWESSAIF